MPLAIANLCPAIKPEPAAIRRLVGGVLRMQEHPGLRVQLVLADDVLLRELNTRYRRHARATDVLSFEPMEPEGPGDGSQGEIYVSMDRVRVQAPRYRHSEQAELARLLVHGTLHVLGHDHMKVAERARMRSLERTCLRSLLPAGTVLFRRLPARARRA